MLPPLPEPETAPPEPTTNIRQGVVLIDRLGLELGTEGDFNGHIDENDPLSAVTEMRQTQTIARGAWQIRIETQLRLSCTHDAFLMRATMRACEGDNKICSRVWESSVPRQLV